MIKLASSSEPSVEPHEALKHVLCARCSDAEHRSAALKCGAVERALHVDQARRGLANFTAKGMQHLIGRRATIGVRCERLGLQHRARRAGRRLRSTAACQRRSNDAKTERMTAEAQLIHCQLKTTNPSRSGFSHPCQKRRFVAFRSA